jgi:hypothetical protein
MPEPGLYAEARGSNDCHRGRKLTRYICVPRVCFPYDAGQLGSGHGPATCSCGLLEFISIDKLLEAPAHEAGKQRDICLPSGLAVGRLMRQECESGVVSGEERPQLRCHIIPVAPCLLWHPMLRRLGDHVGFSPTGITEECSPNSLHSYVLCDIISSADNLRERPL